MATRGGKNLCGYTRDTTDHDTIIVSGTAFISPTANISCSKRQKVTKYGPRDDPSAYSFTKIKILNKYLNPVATFCIGTYAMPSP